MKWINASERLPELQVYKCIKYTINGYSYYIGAEFFENSKKGVFFYDEDNPVFIKTCEDCYWLDETSEDYSGAKIPIYTIEKKVDWQLLEEKFCKEWNKRIFANNRMHYWEINQWYKDNI